MPTFVLEGAMMTHQTATSSQRKVPGPSGIPVLGSALDLRRDLLETFEDAQRRYGDVVRISAGPPGLRVVMYVVFSPEGVRQVLTGTGQSLFTRRRIADYVEVMAEEIAVLIDNGSCTRW
ncbi:MAG: cytochrome P450 [Actinomycetota bacterium]|nr:cytochrome P450 [Actinomycetota bacterium]